MKPLYKTVAAGAAFCAFALASVALAGSFDRADTASGAQLSSFSTVYVAPVRADLDLDVMRFDRTGYRDRPVRNGDIADKADDLYDEIVSAFSGYAMASGSGDGILTIEATLTGLESSRPTLADYDQQVSLSARSVYAGGAEVDFVLSENGKTLAEVSDSYSSTLTDRRPRSGLWSDADRAFRNFAHKLVNYVESN